MIHRLSRTKIGQVWYNMKYRCYNKTNKFYERYGGRGIKICDEWLNDLKVFYDWCIANGWEKHLDIDRIDNDGNYEPSNCRFVTRSENCLNKATNRVLTYNGETKTLQEWADQLKMYQGVLVNRINTRKWSVEKALSIPLRHHKNKSPNINSKTYIRKLKNKKSWKSRQTL